MVMAIAYMRTIYARAQWVTDAPELMGIPLVCYGGSGGPGAHCTHAQGSCIAYMQQRSCTSCECIVVRECNAIQIADENERVHPV